MHFKKQLKFILSLILGFSTFSFLPEARAAKGGGGLFSGKHSLMLGVSSLGPSQDDLNAAIDDANAATAGGISTKNFSSGYELFGSWIMGFGSLYSLVLRPGYFTQSTTGAGAGQSYDYKISALTFFPIFRIKPLENKFIKFFMQVGLGYGSLDGEVKAAGQSLTYKGSGFGALGGLGVDFCFTEAHCLTIEGNMRYLPIERNIVGSGCSAAIPGFSQCSASQELERANKDVQTSLSGVMGTLAYTLNF